MEVRPQIEPNIAYNDDGTFTCSYTPTAPGELQVAVKLDDLHIEGSPWTVAVRAAGAAEPAPAAKEETPAPAPAKEEAPAAAAAAPPAAAAAAAPVKEEAPVPAKTEAAHADAASSEAAHGHAEAAAQVFSASGLGLHEAVAGRAATFEVACRGHESGALEPARGRLQVLFDGPKAVTHVALRAGTTVGAYVVEYVAPAPGAYTVTLLDPRGKPLVSSPFALRVAEPEVRPAAPTAAKAKVPTATRFSVVGPGAKDATAGKTARFEIHGRDDDGQLAASTARLEVAFRGPRPIYAPAVTDGGARGVWHVEYQAVKEGAYEMTVTADGKPIDGSPFAVQVAAAEHKKEEKAAPAKEEAGVPEAAAVLSASKKPAHIRYEVVGAGAKEAVAGKTARFHILATDASGNQVPSLAKFDVSFEGPRPVYAPSVKEDPEAGRGAYHVEYQAIVPGAYRMTVTADGHALDGSPFEVAVSGVEKAPAPAAKREPEARIDAPALKSAGAGAERFSASGAGAKEAVAGKTARFEVHVKDEAGAHVPTLKRIEVAFEGPRPVYAPSVVESATKGIYNVEYLTPVGGTYRMSVTADGQHIEGSPFEVAVQAAAKEAVKEEPLGRDPQAQISVSLKSTGAKDVSYTVQGAGAKDAVAGKTAKFEIHARDADGLLVPNRGKVKLAVAFEGPRPVYAPAVTEDPAMRGVYRVEYSTPAAGTYLMHITSEGQPIANSPFTVTVTKEGAARAPAPAAATDAAPAAAAAVPAAAAAAAPAGGVAAAAATAPSQNMERFKYEAGGAGLSKGHAGRAVRFTVSAKDKQTRPLADTGLEASVEGPGGEVVPVAWEEQPKGVYAASYVPTKEGAYKVTITAAGGHVSRSPYTAAIKAASSAAATGVENWFFTVKARSAAGEDQDEGEDAVAVEVRGPSEVAPKVKDLGNGEYFVSLYGLKEPGAYAVAVSLNGAPIGASPFTITKS